METIRLTQPIWATAESTRPVVDIPCVVASSSAAITLAPPPRSVSLDYTPVVIEPDPGDRFLPIGVAVGVLLVGAVGVVDYATSVSPTYEAHVELAPQASGFTHLDVETQLELMDSPALLEPAVDQLQARSIDVTYDELIQALTIQVNGDTFDIRYRHADPDTAQAVIDQLSATYLGYGQTCREASCLGLEFIEAELPQVKQQVQTSQARLRQLYAEGLPPDQQARILTARTLEAQRQNIELQQRLSAAYREKAVLQERLGASPGTPAFNVLGRDRPYQQRLQELRQVEQQIAAEFGRVQSNTSHLRALYHQHSYIAAQLNQEAQGGLRRFLANPRGPADPVFQQPLYGELLQKLIGVVHQIEVLELRQKTLAQAESLLAQESDRIAGLTRRYETLQQELMANTRILQSYIDRREQLQADAVGETTAWQLVSPPELIPPDESAPMVAWPNGWPLVSAYSVGAIAGVVGAVAAVGLARRRQKVIEAEFV